MMLIVLLALVLVASISSESTQGKPFQQLREPKTMQRANEIPPMNEAFAIICATYNGDQDDQYVAEWAQYHKFLGFDRIYLYPTYANGSSALMNLAHSSNGYLNVEPAERKYLTAFYKCGKPYSTTHTWATFIGVDEFIVLRNHSSIQSLLHDMLHKGGALSLNRYLFGSNGQASATADSVLERFTARSAKLDARVKTITYMPFTRRIYKHYTVVKEPYQRIDTEGRDLGNSRNLNRHPTDALAVIHHYHLKSAEDYRRVATRRAMAALQQPATGSGRGTARDRAPTTVPEGTRRTAEHSANATTTANAVDTSTDAWAQTMDSFDAKFHQLDQQANAVRDASALTFFLQRLKEEAPVFTTMPVPATRIATGGVTAAASAVRSAAN